MDHSLEEYDRAKYIILDKFRYRQLAEEEKENVSNWSSEYSLLFAF